MSAREVDLTGTPCKPSLTPIWNSFADDGVCNDEPTERMSLAAITPPAGESAFASCPPPAAPDAEAASASQVAFRHPYFG